MFDVFGSLKSLIKTGTTIVDNKVFSLHYKGTFLILVAFSLLVTSKQYIGDPIDCIANIKGDFDKLLDTYCWIHSTYTLPSANGKEVGSEVAHPGVDNSGTDEEKVYHEYYQWVCFVLFFQAIMFYVPRYIWKSAENNRIRNMVLGLNLPVVTAEDKKKKSELLAQYFVNSQGKHKTYAYTFFLCETLNLINVTCQIAFVNVFLGGEFSKYGAEVVQFTSMDQEDRVDPMIKVFPRMTKCNFHTYGPSGDIQKYDALCILPLNVVNEKIYVFLWFWFIILSIISGLVVLWRIPIIFSSAVRYRIIQTYNRFANPSHLRNFVNDGDIGDWFVLHLLGKNVDSLHFKEIVDEIANAKHYAVGKHDQDTLPRKA